jgi:flagellar basal-body rod protein FlgF
MIYGLYLSTMGALIEDTKTDVTANNLANVSTVGFKPDEVVFRVRPPEPKEDVSVDSGGPELLEEIGGGALIAEIVTNLRQSGIKVTGRALDIALDGEGFLGVSDGKGGERLYTRAGNLMIHEGYLKTQGGMFVLDDTGRPIELTSSDVNVSSDGTILEVGQAVARMMVVKPSTARAMRKVGATLFAMSPAASGVESEAVVRSGSLEMSGANPVLEIASMIESMRAYEANLQLIRLQDSTLERAVNEVGRVSA